MAVVKPCENCAIEVRRTPSQLRKHTFCSRECYLASDYHAETVAAANKKRHPVDSVIRINCLRCGVSFRRPRSQYRNRNFCSVACRQDHWAAGTVRQVNSAGYIKRYIGRGRPGADKSGHILEHRKVMQDFLGRPLLPEENVHHKNGVRADNRLSNLELWSRSQPSGQRVADKLRWAREFVALYGDLQ